MASLRKTLLLTAALLPGLLHASEVPLLDEVSYHDRADHTELEIHLGFAAEIESFTPVADGTFRLSVRPTDTSAATDWGAMELSFDEADRLLETVSIDGSTRKGYVLEVRFREPVEAQLLPQFDDRQVLLKLTERSAFGSLTRFGKPTAGDPYVINLESRRWSVPGLEDLPEAYARSHIIYLTRFEKDGTQWQRLRLGFFPDAADAEHTAQLLRRWFPDAWVVRISQTEVRFAEAFRINPDAQIARVADPEPAASAKVTPALEPVVEPLASAEPDRAAPAEQPEPSAPAAPARAVVTPPEVTDATPASSAPTPTEPTGQAEDVTLTIALTTPSNIGGAPATQTALASDWKSRERVAPAEPDPLDELLEDAGAALAAGRLDEAIALYEKLLAANQEPYRQRALEMLGVARELNGQLAHAVRYYRTYLDEYGTTDEAQRVDQRLASLLALDDTDAGDARPRKVSRDPESWRLGAQLSQFYQRHDLKIDDRSTVPIHGIFNDFNLQAARRGGSLDQEIRVSMSYLLDFTGNERLDGREYQVSTAYWDVGAERLKSRLRMGRQSRWDSGALGRFDGAAMDFQATSRIMLGLTGGYLIDSSYNAPGGERPFFALNGEYLSESGNLSVKPFYVQQYADGLLDRQAVGLHTQLYGERGLIFSLVDYDLHHKALNNFTVTGNLRLGRSQLNASYEHRKNPYLTTRNALMGQPLDDLTELEVALLDIRLEEIAADRTASSDSVRLGMNTRLGERWTVSADVMSSRFHATEASLEIPGLPSQRTLYSSVQLRSADVFGRGSYSAMTVRVADSATSDTTSVYWDNRIRLGNLFQFSPRFRVDHRNFDSGDTQWSFRPSLRLDYRPGRRVRFELEGGYQWTTREMADRDLSITGLILRAGYRASL